MLGKLGKRLDETAVTFKQVSPSFIATLAVLVRGAVLETPLPRQGLKRKRVVDFSLILMCIHTNLRLSRPLSFFFFFFLLSSSPEAFKGSSQQPLSGFVKTKRKLIGYEILRLFVGGWQDG